MLVLVISTLNSLFIVAAENFKSGDKAIDGNAYQAVFLTNNQIYFGHVKNGSSDYVTLEDVYYIQVNNSDSTQNRLVRLGDSEPHGPKNQMIIIKATSCS